MERERTPDEIREGVRESYARVAETRVNGSPECACCEGEPAGETATTSCRVGYTAQELADLPEGADLGLGCGNPRAIAALSPGETVVDLGSGGGIDCFLSAKHVGPTGRVIGVDMTPEMVSRARKSATEGGYRNVEFRLGEIEHLPVADATVDAVISNCVINLSPDKAAVFAEAFRVLRPGGRLAVSDVVATAPIPPEVKEDPRLYSGCVAGAVTQEEYEALLRTAGFENIRVGLRDESREFIREWREDADVSAYVLSASITAQKPTS